MAMEQTAYLQHEAVPQRPALQAAIDALGFDLKIDDSYAPFKSSGFLPCMVQGKLSGFEIYFDKAADQLAIYPHVASAVGSRDAAIGFRWGGRFEELACVLMVSAALAKSFGAVVHYQDDDILYSTDQLMEELKSALKLIR
jgi:hypothetical protein